ncbi:MAG: SBBP repeat-containing protein [Acidobacteriia bacterium]|nr:SBBP repeat-containing protein [Terriglobia bacterium]
MAKLKSTLMDVPLSFELNRGQTDAKAKFLTRAQGFNVFLTPSETVIHGRNGDVLRMKLQNANQSPKIVGEDRQQKITNYFVGDRSTWLKGVPNYGQVRYQSVYSGVDMVYHSDQRQLEYDFVVKPGADPSQIRVAFEGASKIRITELGDLELKSAAGTSVNHKPVVYQTIDGRRKVVNGEFALANNLVGFKIGEYDHTQPLVIDPTLQVLSFFGGASNDEAAGIATSAVQATLTPATVVFVGRAQSLTLPSGTGTAAKPSGGISWDAFATGLNTSAANAGLPAASGTAILWTTYFGGNLDDAARAVAMDNQGNVYIAGYTNSNNFNGDVTHGQASTYDAFVAKASATSGAISAFKLYGGPGVDQATSIALDYSTFSKLANPQAIINPAADTRVAPNVLIGGSTSGQIGSVGSPADAVGKFPDGSQTAFNTPQNGTPGTTDGFVAIFDNTLALLHATYIGGGGNDQVNGVAADIWGNIYATGFATPNVAAVTAPGALPSFFPVVNGIGVTPGTNDFHSGNAAQSSTWDASRNPQGSATAFAAKWACTTGTPFPIGVPSPAPQIPACGGTNNLKTLSNSALFGGSALGNTFINPEQRALGLPGITESGLGIAVDQGGWGQQGVTSVTNFFDATGFPDIVPANEGNGNCNPNATGFLNQFNAQKCAVSSTRGTQPTPNGNGLPPGNNNSTDVGGFQPGLSGPHVYIVGTTASRDFANSLVNASCTAFPFTSNGGNPGNQDVPALCNIPQVWGSVVVPPAVLPTPVCDPVRFCSPNAPQADIRVKLVNGNTSNSGQTQGWLVSLQFPAVTQVVVQPPLTTAPQLVTTLNPPTIPNYIVLQPPTCPQQDAGTGAAPVACQAGGANLDFTAASPPPAANFGCTNAGGVSCPAAFIGSWNAVAVDSDQQVYVVGQVGLPAITVPVPPAPGQPAATFGQGPPTRLALEIERISPYSGTAAGGNGFFAPLCDGGNGQIPCAFPEPIFPTSTLATTSSFVVDSATTGSVYGQILPGAPPSPDPNQPGGVGNGIAVNALREAFFVGTTTSTPAPAGAAGTQAFATVNITAGAVVVGVCPGGAVGGPACTATQTGGTGYSNVVANAPAVTITGFTGCTTTPGPWTAVVTAGVVTAINPASSGAGCTASAITVTIAAPPPAGAAAFSLVHSPIATGIAPVPATILGLGAGTANASKAPATEDVLYGAIQFYDAIATPTAVNFTANINDPTSVFGPNSVITDPNTMGANAHAFITYTNWEQQVLNIPPGCTVTPLLIARNVTAGSPGQPGGGNFLNVVQQGTTAVFDVTVNPNAVTVPGVISALLVFIKNSAIGGPNSCTGAGQQPLDSWDPVPVTLTVSSSLNLSAENGISFVITSKVASGVVDQFFAGGQQLVANQFINAGVDVSTASSNGPINFTAQIVPGQNWAGNVTNAVFLPTPTDIIYEATGPNQGGPTRVNVGINTQQLAGLPEGRYTAYIVFAASPETPALPTSGSTACSAATTPPGSGTTSPACIPIDITITPNQLANAAVLVFGSGTAPKRTQVPILNSSATPYNFTAAYQPTPVFGTALPAANVFFVGTASTLTPATFGATVGGTVPPNNGLFSLPILIDPAGLPTGVYSGQILLNSPGNAPTAQTTVPIYVYVGPHTGEDAPFGGGLGLMLPVNLPPIGTGGSQGAAPGTPGSYPITLSVPSGVGPNGLNQIPNPTLIQVTGLNNNITNTFGVMAPVVSANLTSFVTFSNPGSGFVGTPAVPGGANPAACGLANGQGTWAQLSSLPGGPLGPTCAWSLWVNAIGLNSTDTSAMAACGGGLGISGTISFSANTAGIPASSPFATLVVPLTVCVTDQPSLTLGTPNTYPNPTFGPQATFINGVSQPVAQPSNLVPGFQQSVVDTVLATSTGSTLGSTASPINLLTLAGSSQDVCKILDIRTNGGVVNGVTIAPTGVQWLTVKSLAQVTGGALFLGPNLTAGSAPNTLRWNSNGVGGSFNFNGGITGLGNNVVLPASPPFAAGPVQVNSDMQTFAICANTDPVGNVSGTFSSSVTIGLGPGAINIPVNMVISTGTVTPPPAPKFSQIGIFRPSTPVGAAQGVFALDANGNNAFDLPADKLRFFGLAGDIPVAGDWDGSGVVRIGVFRPSNGHWYLDMNNNGQWDGSGPGLDLDVAYGLPSPAGTCVPSTAAGLAACTDIPVVGDWGGTGTTRLGVFRSASGQWFLDNQNPLAAGPHTSFATFVYGQPGDLPVVANWSGTGTADQIGVYRQGTWFVDSNGDGIYQTTDATFNFGSAGDIPVTGKWNGTATKKIGVFSANGQWFLDLNGDRAFNPAFDIVANFGLPGDLPVVGGPWSN